ncbi:RE2 [Symbiodinium sp. CCMP2456]|nr:RE2 [Symbiodinium sp. CCMP2456]
MESFLRSCPSSPKQAALAMTAAHNSLAKVHGFAPLQWALGRDWTPGFRLHETSLDEISAASPSTPWSSQSLRIEAEKAFLEHRHREAATRAKNSRPRMVTQFLPGDLVFFRRYKHPADTVANAKAGLPEDEDRPAEAGSRRPSAYVWAVSGGRIKKFHMSQLRHASEQERLIAEATEIASMPWTFTSLQKLMAKGTYDDESRPPKRRWGESKKLKRQVPARAPTRGPDPPSEPRHVRDSLSDEEMVPHDQERARKRDLEPSNELEGLDDELDVERLLHDVTYLPAGLPVERREPPPSGQAFREQRVADERRERPWHVQRGESALMTTPVGGDDNTLYSAIIDVPEDAKAWKKILKNPAKFLAKSVQKGVEISYHKLNEEQKKAMDVAKAAEVQSWVGSKVARAANIPVAPDEALKMRWVYTFKAVPEDSSKIKAKARIVVLGFSDPSLLERDTSSPALTRTSKMLLLNLASSRRWRIMAGDVRTAFLQAKAQDRVHPLFAKPLPELAEAFRIPQHQMLELLGSAYGLTSAPREWYVDLSTTLRKLGARVCKTDPCLWRVFSEDGSTVIGVLGIHVDDILLAGDEAKKEWVEFVHKLHGSYQWAPWETDSFTHCGVGLQQLYDDDSILLNHEEYCANISQVTARPKNEDGPLREDELSQLRAVHGAIQWRVTQTAPHHAAKLSYLQSHLATKDVSNIDMTNKLVREIHAGRHLSVNVNQLNAPAESLVVVGWSDAAVANRPDGSSTGGHIYGLMRPEDVERGSGRVNVVGWKSGRLQRVARPSLAAETQALADLEQEVMFTRLTWSELLGHEVSLENTAPTVAKVPAVLITDARALFDALEKGSIASSGYSMKDKYTALEMQALSQHVEQQGTVLQWVDSDHQLADGLTKIQKQDVLKKFLSQGTWRLRLDGALLSAKKRRALLGAPAE